MASPYRCTVTIDGTKFEAVSAQVVFTTDKDHAGMPEMGSLRSRIRVWADFHDDKNLPYSSLQKFFELANVATRDKIKDMKIEFWKDDTHEDALCCYKFKGWISNYEVSNPPLQMAGGGEALNHMLVMDLEPVMNQQNYPDIQLTS
jgi:hypothetical protein